MNIKCKLSIFSLFLLICIIFGCSQEKETATVEDKANEDLQLDKIPNVIMETLMAKFPKAEIQKWTQETENDEVIYDIEFTQDGWKFEADIKEDGSIHNWEKAIGIINLPEIVKNTAEKKYPKGAIKEIMETTVAVDGKDVLEGYEIVLETAEMTEVEIMIAPDGKLLEDSEDMKAEED